MNRAALRGVCHSMYHNYYSQSQSYYDPRSSSSSSQGRSAPTTRLCAGFADISGCPRPANTGEFCSLHVQQGRWSSVPHITFVDRAAHAQERRCCGLTQLNQLCRILTGAESAYCHLHWEQRIPAGLDEGPGDEPPSKAVLRMRGRQLDAIKKYAEEAEAERARWANERMRQEREEFEAGARQQRQRRQSQREEEEARKREEREQQERAQQQREQARRAAEDQNAAILQRYIDHCAEFDTTTFTSRNPNYFTRIPWPVLNASSSGAALTPKDVDPARVNDFLRFLNLQPERKVKTTREIDMLVKNVAWRFHPDRFNDRRAVVSTIQDLKERAAVMLAADVVIKTVNNWRGS